MLSINLSTSTAALIFSWILQFKQNKFASEKQL